MTRTDLATKIAATINDDGEVAAKTWAKGEAVRVYVSRELSRGRRQDMGYIDIAESGEVSVHVDRRGAYIESLVKTATA